MKYSMPRRITGDLWQQDAVVDWEKTIVSVNELDLAIDCLNSRTKTMVTLWGSQGKHLVVGGGNGRYIVFVSEGDTFWNLQSDTQDDGTEVISIGGQEGEYQRSLVVSKAQAIKAAHAFYADAVRDPDQQWKRQE